MYFLFVSISQVIGCEAHLRNDLDCVGWGVKLYSKSHSLSVSRQHRRLTCIRQRAPPLVMMQRSLAMAAYRLDQSGDTITVLKR